MASIYIELPLRSVGSISAPGLASEATLNSLLTELQLKADLTETQPVSVQNASLAVTGTFWQATQPISGSVSVSNLPVTQPVSGTFWQATQPVSGPLTDAELRAVAVPVSGTFWQATQPVSIASMPSTPVTGTFWQATQPVSIASVPTHAVTQSGTWTVAATPPSQLGSFDEDATVSTTPETFTAPAGAFACFIEADDTNTTNIRIKMGATSSTTSGIQFQAGRSEFYQGGSNISYCTESGTGKLSVQWFTR